MKHANSSDLYHRINRRHFLKTVLITGGFAALIRIPDVFALSAKRITIATAGFGSMYFALGRAIARTIAQHTGLEAVAEITSGKTDNCELVGSKKSDLGLVASNIAYEAFHGTGIFERRPVPIRALTALFPNYPQSQVQNIVICHRDMDGRTAYNVLKIIFEHLEEISAAYPQAKHMSPQHGASLTSLPYHPGAQKFFTERGFNVPS